MARPDVLPREGPFLSREDFLRGFGKVEDLWVSLSLPITVSFGEDNSPTFTDLSMVEV